MEILYGMIVMHMGHLTVWRHECLLELLIYFKQRVGKDNLKDIEFVYTSTEYINQFNKAVDEVAKERKYLGRTYAPPLEKSKEFVEHIINNNLPQYFALKGGELIGWSYAIPLPYEGMEHVASLGMGIVKGFRESGLGAKLLGLTIDHAKKHNGVEKIELDVYKSNKRAIHFYKKNGFILEGEKEKARKLDGIYDNVLVMGKFL